MKVKIDQDRLNATNLMLMAAYPDLASVYLEFNRGFYFNFGKNRIKWVAITPDSDYPQSSHKIPIGGTGQRLVSQSIRWIKHKPHLPLRVISYWCSALVGINRRVFDIANEHGWPADVPCVFCKKNVDRFDWFHLDKISGPGCKPFCPEYQAWIDEKYRRRVS